jgi:hypothetical protein
LYHVFSFSFILCWNYLVCHNLDFLLTNVIYFYCFDMHFLRKTCHFDRCRLPHGWLSSSLLAWQHIFIYILMEKCRWLHHNQCNRWSYILLTSSFVHLVIYYGFYFHFHHCKKTSCNNMFMIQEDFWFPYMSNQVHKFSFLNGRNSFLIKRYMCVYIYIRFIS